MDPERVLELMRSAPQRYETVRAALRYRGNGSLIKEVIRRHDLKEGISDPDEDDLSSSSGRYVLPDSAFGWRLRVWYAGRGREGGPFRNEVELPKDLYPEGGTDITASDGRAEGPSGLDTFVEERIGEGSFGDDPGWMDIARDGYWSTYIFDPEGITRLPSRLRMLDLQTAGTTIKAGKEAVRLVGLPTEGQVPDLDPPWWGADRYELSVDVERGIILHAAAFLRGEEIDSLQVEKVRFDERFPEEVFTSPGPLPWA